MSNETMQETKRIRKNLHFILISVLLTCFGVLMAILFTPITPKIISQNPKEVIFSIIFSGVIFFAIFYFGISYLIAGMIVKERHLAKKRVLETEIEPEKGIRWIGFLEGERKEKLIELTLKYLQLLESSPDREKLEDKWILLGKCKSSKIPNRHDMLYLYHGGLWEETVDSIDSGMVFGSGVGKCAFEKIIEKYQLTSIQLQAIRLFLEEM